MLEHEAKKLGNDIAATWRLGPDARIWHDELTTWIDYDAAARAYTHLRRTRTGRDMDIATFATEYQRQRRNGTPDAYNPDDLTGCPHCNYGWITVNYRINERDYHGVTPCDCVDGRRMARVHSTVYREPDRPTHTPVAAPTELLEHLDGGHTLFDQEHERTDA